MSPDLFNFYIERILRELQAMPELVVGGKNLITFAMQMILFS